MAIRKNEHSVSRLQRAMKAVRGIFTGALLMTTTAGTLSADVSPFLADQAFGNDNPVLSFNAMPANYYSPGMQYLDIMEMSYWLGHLPGQWGGMTQRDLREGGFLNSDGEILSVPDELDHIGMLWSATDGRSGTYVLTYSGEGEVDLHGDAKIISREPGRIVFENFDDNSMILQIFSSDPNGNGNYLHDMSIVREEYVELYEAGAKFNPEWMELISDARQLRFMDWQNTNNSTKVSWTDGYGDMVADMVRVANEAGADPWFCIPHMADENFIRTFAEYVKDNLDPNLQVRVEYSNEAWNYSFKQTKWLLAQAQEQWGINNPASYHAKMATETALIWEDVFGEESDARLINVLGVQTGNEFYNEQVLTAKHWAQFEPESFVDPTTVFEEIGMTNYFGGVDVVNPQMRATLLEKILDPSIDASKWLYEKMLDPNYTGSIPYMKGIWAGTVATAEKYGLSVSSYEGGQHMHHSFAVKGITEQEVTALTDFFQDFIRTEEMAKIYEAAWNAWTEVADTPFMQYGDIMKSSKWGSWGFYESLDDASPRVQMLEYLSDTTDPWWDAVGGEQYQNGVIAVGTDESELHVGSSQEDYIAGKGGDDIFVLGLGDDGAHGGDGYDVVVMRGAYSDYTVTTEGDGYRVEGPEGSDFLIEIEAIRFSSGEILDLATMTVEHDETYVAPPINTDLGEGPADPTQTDMPVGPADPEVPAEQDEVVLETPPDVDLGETETEEPAPVIDTDPLGVDTSGTQYDALDQDEVGFNLSTEAEEAKVGIVVSAINRYSSLGKELGADLGSRAYTVFEFGAKASIEGTTIGANYWTLEEGKANATSSTLGNSTADVTKLLGSIVTNVSGVINGSDYDDKFIGRGAADIFSGGAGSDKLYGGNGNDVLSGGEGNDHLYGGDGHDVLIGGAGNDVIDGGEGNDTLWLTGASTDYAVEKNGDRWIVRGLDGTDVVTGVEAVQFADGTQMTFEEMQAGATAPQVSIGESILGTSGETVSVGGFDRIGFAAPESDGETSPGLVISGINQWSALGQELGADLGGRAYTVFEFGAEATINGTTIGANYWTLEEGKANANGTVLGESALEITSQLATVVTNVTGMVDGSDFDDMFIGRDAADLFSGGAGNDKFYGRDGDDVLSGGAGSDKIYGGAGDDTLIGGADNDLMDGGEGNDIAIFAGSAADYDVIFQDNLLRVSGTDGSDRLSNVEILLFESGEQYDVDRLADAFGEDTAFSLSDVAAHSLVDHSDALFTWV